MNLGAIKFCFDTNVFSYICRKVLERAIIQSLPARKMKTLYKKFISFEEAHGTPENVARIVQMIADYVEKKCSKEST